MFPSYNQFRQQAKAPIISPEVRGLLAKIISAYSPVVAVRQMEQAAKLTDAKFPALENLQKNMRAGKASKEACWAYYYWLHHERMDSPALATLDRLIGLDSSEWFTRAPNLSDYLGVYRVQNSVHFTRGTTDLIGREHEQATLRSFLEDKRPFSWLQLAGEAGQGKSRLALELIDEAKGAGWSCGFLSEEGLGKFRSHWAKWEPDAPTLIVVDYILGKESDVAVMFQQLVGRATEFFRPVRLLLLERQPWNHGGLERPSIGRAEFFPSPHGHAAWFLDICKSLSPEDERLLASRFGVGVVALQGLDGDHLSSIVRKVLEYNGLALPSSDSIKEKLARIDGSGRPLFALLLGESLVAGDFSENWSREDLLTATLHREQAKRWSGQITSIQPPKLDGAGPSMRLARLATMVGGLDGLAISRNPSLSERLLFDVDELFEAMVLVDAPRGTGAPLSGFIPPVRPDLLGEWFVLWAFASGSVESVRLARDGWSVSPNKMAAFLNRCCASFPHRPELHWLLDLLPEDEAGRLTYHANGARLVNTLVMSGATELPSTLREVLVYQAATMADPLAMHTLGVLKLEGVLWEQHVEQGRVLLEKAIEAGYTPSFVSLAGMLIVQNESEGSLQRAFSLLESAAMAGEATGMAMLASCYARGIGTPPDSKMAFEWSSKAASCGDPLGYLELAHCYWKGLGTPPSPERRIECYERAASSGNLVAMVMLGECLLEGIGGAMDRQTGLAWIERAARADSSEAMFMLALRYFSGRGVGKDAATGFYWLSLAAKNGEQEAMLALARLLESGPEARRDQASAIYWHRRAAEAGNSESQLFLAIRHFAAAGVEGNDDAIAEWFKQYDLSEGPAAFLELASRYLTEIGAAPSHELLHRLRSVAYTFSSV